MLKLAIKGHPTRGKEVIQLLEMLGGKNSRECFGNYKEGIYYLHDEGEFYIICCSEIDLSTEYEYSVFTLEEFEEKFPYKVGDKVMFDCWECVVTGMEWSEVWEKAIYIIKGIYVNRCVYTKDLRPYKEQKIMEENNSYKKLDFIKELPSGKLELILGDYEVKEENGKTYLVKKQPKYPKTYKECCDILDINYHDIYSPRYKKDLLIAFQDLLICRDAYWKFAGDWKPDYTKGGVKYCLTTEENIVIPHEIFCCNYILIFPTKEMRDAFYENFKELIELCKELL